MRARLVAATLALAAFGIVATQPSPASAQSLSDRETARGLMEDGEARREKGDLKGALKSFEAADAIMHVPSTAIEVANTQEKLGLLLEAKETVARLQRMPAKANEPAPFKAARAAAEQLGQSLANRIPTLSIVLKNADALSPRITVDGEPVPLAAAEAPRRVNPGPHTIVVTAGSAEKREEVKLVEGQARVVTIELTTTPVAKREHEGDGAGNADAGTSSGGSSKALVYGGFAVGALGVGVGAVTGLMSFAKVSDLETKCGGKDCPPELAADVDSAKSLGTVSTIAFIVGGAGVTAGIIGLLLPSGEEKAVSPPTGASRPVVRPVASPSFVGLVGRF